MKDLLNSYKYMETSENIVVFGHNLDNILTIDIDENRNKLSIIKKVVDDDEAALILSSIIDKYPGYATEEDIYYETQNDSSYVNGYTDRQEELIESYSKIDSIRSEVENLLTNILDNDAKSSIQSEMLKLKHVILSEMKNSYLDSMTNLLNKQIFMKLIGNRDSDKTININPIDKEINLDRAIKGDKIVMIDLTNFKYVNDRLGHEIGDKILIEYSNIIMDKFGDYSHARLGGDEFAAIVRGDEQEKIHIFKNYIKSGELSKEIEKRVPELKGFEYPVGAGVGISEYNPRISASENLKNADQIMNIEKISEKLTTGSYNRRAKKMVDALCCYDDIKHIVENDKYSNEDKISLLNKLNDEKMEALDSIESFVEGEEGTQVELVDSQDIDSQQADETILKS